MDIKDHPCAQGLTLECFRAYPQWAKKMFAYRLLLTLCPHEITKRLPQLKGLFPLLVPPDWPPSDPWVPGYSIDSEIVFPPGWTSGDPLPEGVTISPGTVFPPGWTPGDTLPAGVTISPGAVFPPGWTPGDQLPEGVSISAGAVFPPGWSAGDPLPEGVSISAGAVFPPGWSAGDPLPAGVTIGVGQRPAVLGSGPVAPIYIAPWEPGPIHRVSDPPPDAVPWLYDDFNNLTDLGWTTSSGGAGSADIYEDELRIICPAGGDWARVLRTDLRTWPTNHTFEFSLNFFSGTGIFYFVYNTGAYQVDMKFVPPQHICLRNTSWGYTCIDVGNYMGSKKQWELKVTGSAASLYLDSALIVAGHGLPATSDYAGRTYLQLINEGTLYVDDLTVWEK